MEKDGHDILSKRKKFAEPQVCSEKVRENFAKKGRNSNSMKFMAIHRNILFFFKECIGHDRQ